MSDPQENHAAGHDLLSGDHRYAHLLAENLHCVLGDRVVLHDVSLKVSAGERVGLIGENGRGKSTLLRALAGEGPFQRGQVVRAVAGQVGFLPQQPGYPAEATIEDVLRRATSQIGELAARMRAAEERMASGDDDLDGPRGSTVRYGGGYRDYLHERAAAQARWWQQYRDWRQDLADARRRLKKAGESGGGFREMRDNNKVAYNAAGSAAEAAGPRDPRGPAATAQTARRGSATPAGAPGVHLAADRGSARGGAAQGEGLVVGDVVRGVDLELSANALYVVTGPNGAGKSTLLSVLAGRRAPDAGAVVCPPGLRVGYLPQDSDFSEERRGLLDTFAAHRAAYVNDATAELTNFGLFGPADFDVPVNRLSAGQWRRLELAVLFAQRPQLLLLDEPTSYLSLVLVEQLQEAVERFTGPVVMVTHDRALRERHRDRLLRLSDGRIVRPA